MHATLQRALEHAGEYVFAEDVSGDGRKHFFSGSLAQFSALYEQKVLRHWYECLQEDRPSRVFLDVDATQPICIDDIVQHLRAALVAFVEGKADVTPCIEVIDSSGQNKFSWHIVVTNVVLKNVYHVGAFVRRLLIWFRDVPVMQYIDTAVYTRNRMFRLPESSKFGSPRVLRSPKHWAQLLVQVPCAAPLDCLEVDESVPVSTSSPPLALFRENEDGSWSRIGRTVAYSRSTACPRLLDPVLDWLDTHEHGETQRHKIRLRSTGLFSIASRSRRCHIAGRTHKGNHIWYQVDLTNRQIVQRCMDSACSRHKHVIPCPEHIWSRWTSGWRTVEPTPNNQNTLFNMSY